MEVRTVSELELLVTNPKVIQYKVSDIIIKKKYAQIVPRPSKTDSEHIFNSIKKDGINLPLVINEKGVLLDGHTRIGFAKRLKFETVPVIIKKFENELLEFLFVIDINVSRRNLTEGQRSHLIVACLDIEEKLAKQRMIEGTTEKARATEKVAVRFNMSPRNVDKVRKIIREGPKEVVEQYRNGKLTTNAAYQAVMKEERVTKLVPLPKGKNNLLYVDWPWKYDNEATGGSHTSGANQKYETMTPDEIIEKYFTSPTEGNDIKKIIAKECVLYMWMTVPMFEDQWPVVEEFKKLGFKYKHQIYWIKTGHKGMGYWYSNQVEILIMLVKGKVEAFRSSLPNYVFAPVGKHSEKPEQIRNLIERSTVTMGLRKKIELFARRQAKGWKSWGNEEI